MGNIRRREDGVRDDDDECPVQGFEKSDVDDRLIPTIARRTTPEATRQLFVCFHYLKEDMAR